MAHYLAAMHGDRFGRMEVGAHQGTPMHLFSYWKAGADKKGKPVVYITGHWAGAESPCDGYTLLGDWDDEADVRFEQERKQLMTQHGVTGEPKQEAPVKRETKLRPTRVGPLERDDGQMTLF